jgi:hypothetical protein
MKVRSAIIALGAVALAAGSCAVAAPAIASAHAGARTHKLVFTSVLVNQVEYSSTSEALQDKDVNGKGQVIGFDELYTTFNPKTGGKATVAVALKGGLLIGKLAITQSGISGTVTGGTGSFAGAKGTISGHSLNSSGTRTAVTIDYS